MDLVSQCYQLHLDYQLFLCYQLAPVSHHFHHFLQDLYYQLVLVILLNHLYLLLLDYL